MNPYMNTQMMFNQMSNEQKEMYIHQEFLKTEEGQKAQNEFANAKLNWWTKINNPQQNSEEVEALKSELSDLKSMMTQLLEQNKNGGKK